MKNDMKKCIFAGTFDPITNGHKEIISKISEMFDEVLVAVCVNRAKSAKFSADKRVEMVEKACAGYKNVKATYYEGLLVDLMKSENIKYNVRGIRDEADYLYESRMTLANSEFFPEMVTVYVPCNEKNKFISSTLVRELMYYGKDVSELVPQEIADLIKESK